MQIPFYRHSRFTGCMFRAACNGPLGQRMMAPPEGGHMKWTMGLLSPAVLCPLLCKNGGVCLQTDRCFCPPNFTGKFCQIAAPPSSTNEIVKPVLLSAMAANKALTRSEFLMPLGHSQETAPSMVEVRVQHPPEASVKIHQVLKVSGFSPDLRMLSSSSSSSSSSGSAGAPAPAGGRVQAQTLRGGGVYNQQSGFKYCFREVKDGQCSSPLPGLRNKEMCCRGIGKAWGITDCVLCPDNTGQSNSSCPVGFERVNGTQCVDVNECLRPGLCENGFCVNTRGSYSCVCRAGFVLDASHGICISQTVISEERGQCYRALGSGQGPFSCSLPILRNITKQICCCSRVGKAWGYNCQRCPYFGSAAFKEICPAGPGYQYSASALQFNQRANEQLGSQGASLVTHGNQENQGILNNVCVRSAVRGVCESKPGVCGRGRCIDQPAGKHTCVCDKGYQPNSQRTYCRDVDECQDNPCSNGRCDNTPGSYRCVCRLGYRLSSNTCTDVDECRLAPCSNGRCENTPGSYRCVCRHGYKLQNNTCTGMVAWLCVSRCRRVCRTVSVSRSGVCERGGIVPLRVLSTGIHTHQQTVCRYTHACTHTHTHTHTPSSLRLPSADVNECEDERSCPGQRCVNTEGSFSCVACQQGYRTVGGVCTDVDECALASQCPGQQCVNTVGSYRCVSCQPGYRIQDGACQDIDECADVRACEAERVCVNTAGSFRCDCRPGYRTSGPGRQCRDINECLEGDFCFPAGECVNSAGSYTCVCSRGFTLSENGTACLDVDECVTPGVCLDGRCVNTDGSFQCQCQTGFTTNPEKTACLGTHTHTHTHTPNPQDSFKRRPLLDGCGTAHNGRKCKHGGHLYFDVDECVLSAGSVCGSQRCENTIGSYHCLTSCEPGYQVTQTGSCVDIDECANETMCGEHALCKNLAGTYLCVCHLGFTSSADGKACVDEDECVSLPGVCGSARCENMEGSFMCECDREGHEFDTISLQCVTPPFCTGDIIWSHGPYSSVWEVEPH
uniref:Latent transforming growth factor beta binding protein 4 n=1 Tax=Mola mola TaxID=94237 RepID=A0A3Q3WTY3_MOLML